jgi:hypothetical protein
MTVRTTDGQMLTVHVDAGEPVSSVKQKVAALCGVPVAEQKIVHHGRTIEGDATLDDYNVQTGSTLFMVRVVPCPGRESRRLRQVFSIALPP